LFSGPRRLRARFIFRAGQMRKVAEMRRQGFGANVEDSANVCARWIFTGADMQAFYVSRGRGRLSRLRALIAFLGGLCFAVAFGGPAMADQWVMGYYVGYQHDIYPTTAIQWQGMTHIIMGRVKANADGTLNTDFDWDATNGPLLAKDIATRAHAAGKKAILMLGGDDNSPVIAQAVANHRTVFVANLVKTMKALGYDGLDLDWENNINWTQFQTFVADLRKAAPTAILTAPTGALNINYDVVDPHVPAIAANLDRLSVMSYYPSTSWAGSGWLSWFNSPLAGEKPSTPVSIDSTLKRYVAAGVPKAKLAMGVSFYATCYTGGVTGPNQSTENGVTIQGGDNDFMLSKLYGRKIGRAHV
jgi:chitinase